MQAASEARFAELINKLNHSGAIKVGSSLLGLMGIISWGLRNNIKKFVTLRDAREWNTTEPITDLSEIESNEYQLAITLARQFVEDDRSTLREFNPDQGIPHDNPKRRDS